MPDRNAMVALRHVGTLLAIAENGSLSAAAVALNTTQSSMTKALRRAEDELGEKLFERHTKGVVPTPAGEAALAYAKLIRQHGEATLNAIDALRDFPGNVLVGAGASFLDALLPAAIAKVVTKMPAARIRLRVEGAPQLLERLRNGELDVLFVSEVPGISSMSDVDWRPLINNEMDIVAREGHPLFDKSEVRLADLLDYGWVLGGETDPQQRHLESVFRARGLVLPIATVEALSRSVALRIIQQSDLLTVMPNLRTQSTELGIAKIVCPEITWVRIAGIAVRRGSVLPPAASELVAEIISQCEHHKMEDS